MGVGCDEYGVCYAEAHGEPIRCPSYRPDFVTIMLVLRRRARRRR